MFLFLKEFLNFLKVRKKFWLYPAVFMLLILSLLLFVTEGSVLAPLIYPIF